jgi:hypothetical protein
MNTDASPHGPLDVPLVSIRRMLEGVIPAVMCTVAADGTPHVCFLSQAEYVDADHVALSFQFFNRSRQNILATRQVCLAVDDPYTASGVRLYLEYLRTETEGPLFERMRAKLAGIASHSGMDKVYHLQGADVYRVRRVQRVQGRGELAAPAPRCDLPSASRLLCERLGTCQDVAALFDVLLEGLDTLMRIDHAMLLLVDATTQRLYTVASRGYAASGVGAEIEIGQGVAGIAAREGVSIRIGHLTLWNTYARAIRRRAEDIGLGSVADDEIPLPGLAEPRSQIAVPLKLMGRVTGELLAESEVDQHFSYDDEDALTVLAHQVAMALALLQQREADAPPATAPPVPQATPAAGALLTVRHFPHNDSVFVADDYLIKGVAGAILRKLVHEHLTLGRVEFSNRELRLDPSLKLPDIADNLEARLILLQRRLAERCPALRLEKTGRGRFRLVCERPLALQTVGA